MAPQTPIHLHKNCQQQCSRVPSVGVFEMQDAQKACSFDAAPQAPIPLHGICQQQCLWIPSMGVFEMHNTLLSLSAAPAAPTALTPGPRDFIHHSNTGNRQATVQLTQLDGGRAQDAEVCGQWGAIGGRRQRSGLRRILSQ